MNVKEDVKPTGHWGTYLLIFFLVVKYDCHYSVSLPSQNLVCFINKKKKSPTFIKETV